MDSAKEHLVAPRRAKNSWISEQTLELIDKKRDAHIHWMQSQDKQETRAKYTELQRIAKTAVRKDKQEWLDQERRNLESDCKQHKHGEFFRKLRKFDKVSVRPPDLILDEQGYKLLTTEDQLARWQRHFESVLNVTRAVTLDTGVSPCSVPGTALNDEEITEAIGKLKNGKATGQDGIAAEFLRAEYPELVDWLIEIIQMIWKTGKVPQEWKDSVLLPLFKRRTVWYVITIVGYHCSVFLGKSLPIFCYVG